MRHSSSNLHITKVLWRICIGIYVHAYIRRERFQFIKWSTFVKLTIYGKTYQIMVRYMFLFIRDGCTRSGVFVALSLVLQKIEIDDEVDIFQMVRTIQIRRPQFFPNFVSLSIYLNNWFYFLYLFLLLSFYIVLFNFVFMMLCLSLQFVFIAMYMQGKNRIIKKIKKNCQLKTYNSEHCWTEYSDLYIRDDHIYNTFIWKWKNVQLLIRCVLQGKIGYILYYSPTNRSILTFQLFLLTYTLITINSSSFFLQDQYEYCYQCIKEHIELNSIDVNAW